ncbi:MAG: hypothetical protein BWX86_02311 [Verrucomicrobia bacterium ADurb.Bin122]|nr:MAG: hypothetical protein BWX86_02311 [Verrucomicrobia bacterium ADurb.Bin122]
MGLAMKIDEKVPVTMPTRKVNERSLMTPPPNMKSASAARKVVTLVRMDRGKTSEVARLITSRRRISGRIFNSSRMRSKTTTVSLIE